MWKSQAAYNKSNVKAKDTAGDDDWETDPDFVNDISEKESRWGGKTVEGSGRSQAKVDLQQLTNDVVASHAKTKADEYEKGPKASEGYGGKFGVHHDRMDKNAVGHDYSGKTEKHTSQKDYAHGFGGKYGVQTDRQDKSSHNWNEKSELAKHDSQKDYSHGFGGKFGVQSDRQDKNALGFQETMSANNKSAAPEKPAPIKGNAKDLRSKFESMAMSSQDDGADAKSAASSAAAKQRAEEARRQREESQRQRQREEEEERVSRLEQKQQQEKREQEEEENRRDERLREKERENEERQREEQKQREPRDEEKVESTSQEDNGKCAIAIYDYVAEENDELSFSAGDSVTHIQVVDDNWWSGWLNGNFGLFPANHVQEQ